VKARVRRKRGGGFTLDLPERERDVVAALLPQLRELLVSGGPNAERLFPPAYANDSEREGEYRALVHDDLLERHLASVDVVEETLEAKVLDEEQLTRWMGAVNDIRLVLGTRLDITEDMDAVDPDDPDAPAYAVYDYLTWLLSQIVDALADY
jgi:Domain of unknown function (DUF2017)